MPSMLVGEYPFLNLQLSFLVKNDLNTMVYNMLPGHI